MALATVRGAPLGVVTNSLAAARVVEPVPAPLSQPVALDKRDRPKSPGVTLLDRPASLRSLRAEFGIFQGVRDDYLLEPLRSAKPVRVKVNRGGSSISLRVDFEGGGRAAFKPDQINLQTIPRKEIAAFRLNRLLGMSAVPPAIARELPKADLLALLEKDETWASDRLDLEVLSDDLGMVRGELSWWIVEIRDARIGSFLLDSVDGMVVWKRYLSVGSVIPEEELHLLAQLSDMVAFDFLTNNVDRWSGSNVKASVDRRTLYAMDNTLSFGLQPDGHVKVQAYLGRVQRFSRTFYEALVGFDEEDVRWLASTDTGPYEELLTEEEIAALLGRREVLRDYIDRLITTHGEAAVLTFP